MILYPPAQGLYDPRHEHDACGCEENSGDGAGLLVKMPDKFFRKEAKKLKINLPKPGDYAVGMIFLPQERAARLKCERALEKVVRENAMVVLGWRDVPVDHN